MKYSNKPKHYAFKRRKHAPSLPNSRRPGHTSGGGKKPFASFTDAFKHFMGLLRSGGTAK